MNQKNFDKLIEAIRSEAHRFDMTIWCEKSACGTVACIGGHCLILMGADEDTSVSEIAEWLGISAGTALALFYPGVTSRWFAITREQAIGAIQNVMEHGAPMWKEVMK